MTKTTEIKQGLTTYTLEKDKGNYFIHCLIEGWERVEITEKEYNDILNEVKAIREVLLNK